MIDNDEPTTNVATSEDDQAMQPRQPFQPLRPELITLHRYWVHANRLREHFLSALIDPEWLELAKLTESDNHRRVLNFAFMLHDPGIFMLFWYSSLYVVVEGWQELGLSDPDVDRLLGSPNIGLLKRFRNGVFHYQKRYFDDRFTDFVAVDETVPWVNELNNAIGAYFRRQAGNSWPVIGPEVQQKFRSLLPEKDRAVEILRTLLTPKLQEVNKAAPSEP